MNLAPIVLFGYNRPKHIKKTLEALRRNELAELSELIIYIDGPARDSDIPLNREVIKVCEEFDWPGTKKFITVRPKNFGLADNIVNGVTQTVNEKGKVIVLEDDIETSKGFLKYMNTALRLYESEEKVMHISGYMFPIQLKTSQETLFYQITTCWGWATWKNRWIHFNPDAEYLLNELRHRKLLKWFDLDDSGVFLNQLVRNVEGTLKSWAIKWQASVNLRGGYSLHPHKSLVRNIGFDNSGTNCAESQDFESQILANAISVEKIPIEFDKSLRRLMKKYYKQQRGNLAFRIKHSLKQRINKLKKSDKAQWHRIKRGPAKGKKLFVAKEAFPGWSKMISGSFDDFWYNHLMKENVRPNTIMDVGCHFGYHTLSLKSMYPTARMIAIEPNPFNLERLKLHLDENDLMDIEIHEVALSNKNGTADFTISSNVESSQSTGSHLSTVIPPLGHEHYKSFTQTTVETITLDTFCQRNSIRPDLIKIDIEGAELNAINGGENIISQYKPILCIETHSKQLTEQVTLKLNPFYRVMVLENEADRSFLYCSPE